MSVRGVVAAMIIVMAGCASSNAQTDQSPAARCGPSSARTLGSTGTARVYAQGGGVYGCSTSTGRTFRLGGTGFTLQEPRVGLVALAGSDAAYALTTHGVDTASTLVIVRRLSDGKTLHSASAISALTGAESFSSVSALVVKRDGATAWIGASSSIASHQEELEVHRIDGRGRALLDSGPGIGPRSLQLHTSRLTWSHAGHERSASLR